MLAKEPVSARDTRHKQNEKVRLLAFLFQSLFPRSNLYYQEPITLTPLGPSLNSNALRQIPRLIHVRAFQHRNVISQ